MSEVEDDQSPERDLLALTDCTVTMMDGVDDAAQLELYSVRDWQRMQLDEAWHDLV